MRLARSQSCVDHEGFPSAQSAERASMCLPIDAGPSRQPDAMSTISLLSSVCRKHALIFAPAMVVWPVWAYTMQVHGVWHEVFSNYWSMSVAMVIGSFVAGSTPLGGGVVAYPISQLVLRWPTPDSRDASILVQSIGMNAAGYLLCVHKRELLDSRLDSSSYSQSLAASASCLVSRSPHPRVSVQPSGRPGRCLPASPISSSAPSCCCLPSRTATRRMCCPGTR